MNDTKNQPDTAEGQSALTAFVMPSAVNLTMFSDYYSQFEGDASCEGYNGNELYFELDPEHKTSKMWEKDCGDENTFFPDINFLPLEDIDPNAVGDVMIIAHTNDYWITLDPNGVFPVLHPKKRPYTCREANELQKKN